MKDFPEVVEHERLQIRLQKTFPDCSQEEYQQLYKDVVKCVTNKAYVSSGSSIELTMFEEGYGHYAFATVLSMLLLRYQHELYSIYILFYSLLHGYFRRLAPITLVLLNILMD